MVFDRYAEHVCIKDSENLIDSMKTKKRRLGFVEHSLVRFWPKTGQVDFLYEGDDNGQVSQTETTQGICTYI